MQIEELVNYRIVVTEVQGENWFYGLYNIANPPDLDACYQAGDGKRISKNAVRYTYTLNECADIEINNLRPSAAALIQEWRENFSK